MNPLTPRVRVGIELQAVLADVRQLRDADDGAGDLCGAAADAGDERVAPGQTSQLRTCRFRHARVLRVRDDRRERAVDIEEQRRRRGVGGEGGERVHPTMISYTGRQWQN